MSDDGRLYAAEDERALLGALLTAPARIVDVPGLTAAEFYEPAHAILHAAITGTVTAADDPAVVDSLAILETLRTAGKLRHVGGATALTDLMADCPAPASARYYADRVAAAALRRRLDSHAVRIRQAVRGDALDDALEAIALASIDLQLDVESPGTASLAEVRDLHTLEQLADSPADPHAWVIPGLLTLEDRVVVVGAEGIGKRLRVDEPIPTPEGWTTMGALVPGERVFDRHGQPCTVTAATTVEPYPDAWTIAFDDGSTIDADADHQWSTVTYDDRQAHHILRVRTTATIRATLRARDGHCANHAIPVAGPLDLPDIELPVPPYTLGVWLGDGATASSRLSLNADDAPAIEAGLSAEGMKHHRWERAGTPASVADVWVEGGNPMLRDLGVLGAKSVPDIYLRASIRQRRALLAGLMDTDGWIIAGGTGQCELTFTCKALIPGVVELIRSLGIKVAVAESDAVLDGRIVGRRWRMLFQSPECPFTVPRKAQRWEPLRTRRSQYRYIVDVRRAEPTPMRCITVDSPDHTYLAGRRMIPTHNTHLARQVAVMAASGLHPFAGTPIPPVSTLIVDLENPRDLVRRKIRGLVNTARQAGAWHDGRAHVWLKPGGINLRRPRDQAELAEVVRRTDAKLVCLGPLYKAFAVDGSSGEQQAAETAQALDQIRARFGCALWLETHAPMAQLGRRDMRPIGSGVWSRWPEFGLGLTKDDEAGAHILNVSQFRGNRDERALPIALARSSPWPWHAIYHPQEIAGARLRLRRDGNAA